MSIISSTAHSSGDSEFYDFPIEQSLRFDGSSYLSKSLSSTSTFTISMWLKSTAGTTGYVVKSGTDVGLNWQSPDTDGRMYMHANNVAVGYGERYRDLSAWYHLVLQSNSGTARFWVNNRAATTNGSTVATLNNFTFNGLTLIGVYAQGLNATPTSSSNKFSGYMANIQFIDGQALDASYFGETKQDIWVPKEYTGSYGTNGFHLDFADSSNIGNDVSGNNNDWTVN